MQLKCEVKLSSISFNSAEVIKSHSLKKVIGQVLAYLF